MFKHLNLNCFEIYHIDLYQLKEKFYDRNNLEILNFNPNLGYKSSLASSFVINDFIIEHRVAKITPKKIGQFVSIWKRDAYGKTAPFSINDSLDFLIISLKEKDKMGQFIFPRKILIEEGIIESKDKKGKMGIRVYPPWVKPENNQAIKSQKWQILFFYDFNNEKSIRDLKNIFEI